MCLTAYIKLSQRFLDSGVLSRLERLTGTYETSVSLELQARSCEYQNLLKQTSVRQAVLAPMPVPSEEEVRKRLAAFTPSQSPALADTGSSDDYGDDDLLGGDDRSGSAPAAAAARHVLIGSNLLDLDDIFGGGGGSNSSAAARHQLLSQRPRSWWICSPTSLVARHPFRRAPLLPPRIRPPAANGTGNGLDDLFGSSMSSAPAPAVFLQ